MLAVSPEIVVLVPVPAVVVPPGVLVNIHVPDAGSPLKTALPVSRLHVGWVILPTVGEVGVDGLVLITTLPDADEIHPEELATVNVNVPDGMPVKGVLDPEPVVLVPPGVLVRVQVPEEGNPLNITLPVPTSQVGWVIVPTLGADGDAIIVTVKVAEVAH